MDVAVAAGKLEPSTVNLLIMTTTALIAVGLIAAAVVVVIVGRAAFHASSPAAAGSFGLLFLALPALTTIVFIVLSTGTLTAMGILPANGCIAIFSSIASFVLGAETQRRREAGSSNRRSEGSSSPVHNS